MENTCETFSRHISLINWRSIVVADEKAGK